MAVIRSSTGRRRQQRRLDPDSLLASIPVLCGCSARNGTASRYLDGGQLVTDELEKGEQWFELSKARRFDRYPGVFYGLELIAAAKASIDDDTIFEDIDGGYLGVGYAWPKPGGEVRQKWAWDCPFCRAHHSIMPMTLTRLVVEAVERGEQHVVVP